VVAFVVDGPQRDERRRIEAVEEVTGPRRLLLGGAGLQLLPSLEITLDLSAEVGLQVVHRAAVGVLTQRPRRLAGDVLDQLEDRLRIRVVERAVERDRTVRDVLAVAEHQGHVARVLAHRVEGLSVLDPGGVEHDFDTVLDLLVVGGRAPRDLVHRP
jgi:hypothetical protein